MTCIDVWKWNSCEGSVIERGTGCGILLCTKPGMRSFWRYRSCPPACGRQHLRCPPQLGSNRGRLRLCRVVGVQRNIPESVGLPSPCHQAFFSPISVLVDKVWKDQLAPFNRAALSAKLLRESDRDSAAVPRWPWSIAIDALSPPAVMTVFGTCIAK